MWPIPPPVVRGIPLLTPYVFQRNISDGGNTRLLHDSQDIVVVFLFASVES